MCDCRVSVKSSSELYLNLPARGKFNEHINNIVQRVCGKSFFVYVNFKRLCKGNLGRCIYKVDIQG